MCKVRFIDKAFVAILIFSIALLFFASQSFAYADDIGEHCWINADGSIFIKLQVTQMGNHFALNGTVSYGGVYEPYGRNNPAFGTIIYDGEINKFKGGYTVSRFDGAITVYMELDPSTLSGIKVINSFQETITYTTCN